MTGKQYKCALFRNRRGKPGAWEQVGESFSVEVNLFSVASRMNALLVAIDRFRGKDQDVEQYGLTLHNDEGIPFTTLLASQAELERHDAGYPVSVSEIPVGPQSLAGLAAEVDELRKTVGVLHSQLAKLYESTGHRYE